MLYQKVCDMEQENAALQERIKQLEEKLGEESWERPYHCWECSHFRQHYGKRGGTYYPISCGHCVAGRKVKKRVREDEVCHYFEKTTMKRI